MNYLTQLSNKANFIPISHSFIKYSTKIYPNEVDIVEVGPRDGLQNEKVIFFLNFYNTKLKNYHAYGINLAKH
jgi:hypothetical protein